MININYQGYKVLANDDSSIVNPLSYWSQEILTEIQLAYDNGDYEIIVEPDPILNPYWDGFNFYLFNQEHFINYGFVVKDLNPYALPGLVEQYGKVAQYGAAQFAPYFEKFCELGQITSEHRQEWAYMAGFFNLPVEFVDVIRGN